jgi:predicted MFS family arabinose efflux permease
MLPHLLDRLAPRSAMLVGGITLIVILCMAALAPTYWTLLPLWSALEAGASLILTPSGLLLKRSAHSEDRPAVFAAQFALSHACWLVTYPLAGGWGARFDLDVSFLVLAGGAAVVVAVAMHLWPRRDPEVLTHEHEEAVHAHQRDDPEHHDASAVEWLQDEPGKHRHRRFRHAHAFTIDDHHPHWPKA